MRAESDAARPARQAGAGHDLGTAWREDADAFSRRHRPEMLGDDQAEHRIGELVIEETAERARRIRRDSLGYGRYFRNARMAFVPPKPNALLSATSTSCLRAWFGT